MSERERANGQPLRDVNRRLAEQTIEDIFVSSGRVVEQKPIQKAIKTLQQEAFKEMREWARGKIPGEDFLCISGERISYLCELLGVNLSDTVAEVLTGGDF